MAKGAIGKVTQVIGTVVDVEFPAEQLPGIYEAITIDARGFAFYRLRNGRRLVNLLAQTQRS